MDDLNRFHSAIFAAEDLAQTAPFAAIAKLLAAESHIQGKFEPSYSRSHVAQMIENLQAQQLQSITTAVHSQILQSQKIESDFIDTNIEIEPLDVDWTSKLNEQCRSLQIAEDPVCELTFSSRVDANQTASSISSTLSRKRVLFCLVALPLSD